jgi:hypothetical protein
MKAILIFLLLILTVSAVEEEFLSLKLNDPVPLLDGKTILLNQIYNQEAKIVIDPEGIYTFNVGEVRKFEKYELKLNKIGQDRVEVKLTIYDQEKEDEDDSDATDEETSFEMPDLNIKDKLSSLKNKFPNEFYDKVKIHLTIVLANVVLILFILYLLKKV